MQVMFTNLSVRQVDCGKVYVSHENNMVASPLPPHALFQHVLVELQLVVMPSQ